MAKIDFGGSSDEESNVRKPSGFGGRDNEDVRRPNPKPARLSKDDDDDDFEDYGDPWYKQPRWWAVIGLAVAVTVTMTINYIVNYT